MHVMQIKSDQMERKKRTMRDTQKSHLWCVPRMYRYVQVHVVLIKVKITIV